MLNLYDKISEHKKLKLPHPEKIIEITIGDFKIFTSGQLDGYGYKHVQDIAGAFQSMTNGKKFNNAMEWCCGPGYIGFTLLFIGMIKKCTFSDIHEPISKVINKTIETNNLSNKSKFICSDNFKNISEQKFDLIVGNPPHFNFTVDKMKQLEENPYWEIYNEDRKFCDLDWKIHKDFFANVNKYLEDDGDILLMENVKGSSLKDFTSMIHKNKLKVVQSFKSHHWQDDIWYIHIRKDL